MLVLLDENVPQRLRLLIVSHDVRTVAYQGWSGLLNGALLTAAEEAGFEVFVTADQSIHYQQNMASRSIALVVLSSNQLSLLVEHAEKITAAIDASTAGAFTFVDVG